jgi:hypothetical protein
VDCGVSFIRLNQTPCGSKFEGRRRSSKSFIDGHD